MDTRRIIISALNTALANYPDRAAYILADRYFEGAALPYPTLWVTADELHKSLQSAAQIWEWLTAEGATREAILVNIGGGTVCDLGGFAAATYLRGIDYINIPTTLLAMVDAAIGGKTGVNVMANGEGANGEGVLLKNRVGAFRMALETVIEPAFLETLPPEELLSGCGEMLKSCLLMDEWANGEWTKVMDEWTNGEWTNGRTGEWIEKCRRYKEQIVQQDPEEKGLRKVLNFGHTIGHALEEIQIVNRKSPNRQYLHGYCVVWGMVAELYLSVVLLGCPRELLTQMSHIMIEHYGRPQCNCKQQGELIALMRKDKKNASENYITFTLLKKAGDPVINQVAEPKVIEEALDYLFSL